MRSAIKRTATRMMRLINRMSPVSRKLDWASVQFHKIHENSEHDPKKNGEAWLLQKLAALGKLDCCFDVGANHGGWAVLAVEANPRVTVHCFEIVPPTFEKLSARLSGNSRMVLNATGLSNAPGVIDVKYSPSADTHSSIVEIVCIPNAGSVRAKVMRGADYCAERGISKIDLLKIDTEGAEHFVLEGFGDFVTPSRIPAVQFEYGQVNIVTKFLLRDFYAYFTARGYKLGKLFPDHVRFRDYNYQDEDFIGPNYIAVSPEIARALGSS